MRTYCKECQAELGAIQRVHLCAYHAATHAALTLVHDIARAELPISPDVRERARDIMARIAKDVLARIGAEARG